MNADLAHLSATELLSGYRRKLFSPVEATRAALDQIRLHNGIFNAFCLIDEEGALAAACKAEKRWMQGQPCGLVDGVPASIKDLLIAKGWPTLRGSKTISPAQAWLEDAPAVARMRENGAIFLGKTTTSEFGWKPLTDSPLTGCTRNPWNSDLTPGGSSGGAAVAAALGMGALHIGTDAAGSIRIPAAFTGIFGLKPTHGRVPAYPPTPNAAIAHVGPITRSVEDAALMLTVLTGYDPRDSYALPREQRDWRIGVERGVVGMRIRYAATIDGALVDPRIAAVVRQAADVFTELGAHVEEGELPVAEAGEALFVAYRVWVRSLIDSIPIAQRSEMDSGLLSIAEDSTGVGLTDFLAAFRIKERVTADLNEYFQSCDLVVMPSVPILPFAVNRLVPESGAYTSWFDWTPFSAPFNFTRVPAASIPCGSVDGLPVGLQVVGPLYREDLVLAGCRAFEVVRPIGLKMPARLAAQR
jgi:aspartyl-tRNA(Asn)/glutamyl-tRNA(Gln) amidotransferase subunit A